MGHSFIKAEMARHKAVFGGEHSAHYYFRDFWFADTGMLAAMHVLAALGEQDGTAVRPRRASTSRYAASGEINSTVADAGAATAARTRSGPRPRTSTIDELDGLHRRPTEGEPMWWFNLRGQQHRAAAAAQRRGGRRADHGAGARRRARHRSEESTDDRHTSAAPTGGPSGPQIEPWLREILRCPQCKARARRRHRPRPGPSCSAPARSAGCAYRVDDGIPVLLVDEARSLTR